MPPKQPKPKPPQRPEPKQPKPPPPGPFRIPRTPGGPKPEGR